LPGKLKSQATFSKTSASTIEDTRVSSFCTAIDEAIFDFTKEKYEVNPADLLRFRSPTVAEKAITGTLPPPGRVDAVPPNPIKPPPPIEYFEDGLNDLVKINEEWDAFDKAHPELQCEKMGDTEYKVRLFSRKLILIDYVVETTTAPNDKYRRFTPPVEVVNVYCLSIKS
jgi:hypothetical protein